MEILEYLKKYLSKLACERYVGNEDLEQIISKWFEPYGVEFAKKYQFPNFQFFELFKKELEHTFLVYINQCNVDLYNKSCVIVNSNANLNFQLPKRINTILSYGESIIKINAYNYSVVNLSNIDGNGKFIISKDKNSKITFI